MSFCPSLSCKVCIILCQKKYKKKYIAEAEHMPGNGWHLGILTVLVCKSTFILAERSIPTQLYWLFVIRSVGCCERR